MRAPVTVAYLLARAADTVADTPHMAASERRQLLTELMAHIASGEPPAPLQLAHWQAIADRQPHADERRLLLALPECLQWLRALPADDQTHVRWVLGHITHGQMLDLTRFTHDLQALDSEAQLDDYTWLVAGCVGEFWTALCERHWPGHASEAPDVMRTRGRHYGMGLQRLNILRDTGADLAMGRCYWPGSLLTPLGLSPQALQAAARSGDASTLNRLTPLWQAQLRHTRAQLAEGLRYSQALKSRRLRLATALPALLGVQTLKLLGQTGPMALSQSVKIPRRTVQALLWRLLLAGVSPQALQREFDRQGALP